MKNRKHAVHLGVQLVHVAGYAIMVVSSYHHLAHWLLLSAAVVHTLHEYSHSREVVMAA